MRVEPSERSTVAFLGVVANKDWLTERDAGCRLARVGGPKVLGGVLFAGYGPLLALGQSRLFPFAVRHGFLLVRVHPTVASRHLSRVPSVAPPSRVAVRSRANPCYGRGTPHSPVGAAPHGSTSPGYGRSG